MTSQAFLDGRVNLWAGDCLEVLKLLPENSVDSVCTDPPYHLTSIVKRFGAENAAACKEGKTGAYARASKGFMGKTWDGGDIAFRPELWAEVLRVLKPGGHILAFSATRNYHRMACAIEDAGFEVRDMASWMYGSGFPKSHDVSKAIDKAAGAEREKIRHVARAVSSGTMAGSSDTRPWIEKSRELGYHEVDGKAPVTDAAKQWEGWGTALKPALEPICLARKPLEGTVAANVLRWGTGALNINGCRIHANVKGSSGSSKDEDRARCPIHGMRGLRSGNDALEMSSREGEAADDLQRGLPRQEHDSAKQPPMDERSLGERERISGSSLRLDVEGRPGTHAVTNAERVSGASIGDGSAFGAGSSQGGERTSCERDQVGQQAGESIAHQLGSSWSGTLEDRAHDDGFDDREPTLKICTCRDGGLGGGEVTSNNTTVGRWPANVILDGSDEVIAAFPETTGSTKTSDARPYEPNRKNAVYGDGMGEGHHPGFGDGGGTAARFFYSAKADADDRLGSSHPTVKPVDLMQYLVRLVTPKGGTVLDCFAGTGTTGEAAFREGMNAILIEREEQYREDIARRMGLCLAGPIERKVSSIKARNKPQVVADDLLSGFGEVA